MEKKIWEVEEIRHNIINDDRWTIRALLAIYKFQTAAEKQMQETVETNGVGFNGPDSNILSSIAEFYLKRNYISDKQMAIVRKKIGKYAKQLTAIANS